MADKQLYEGRSFKVLGLGRNPGDVRVMNPDGKTVFVSNVPTQFRQTGAEILVRDYRKGMSSADFAQYAGPYVRPSSSNMPEGKNVYILHIGATTRGEDSAIAVINDDVLKMKPYDALMYLLANHENKAIYVESTDRRIAASLHDVVSKAQREKALEEVVLTIGAKPVTQSTVGTLKDYFASNQQSNYSASAAVTRDQSKTASNPAAPAADTPVVLRQRSTVVKKGSPGSLDEIVA
jgi:hypothetical protein